MAESIPSSAMTTSRISRRWSSTSNTSCSSRSRTNGLACTAIVLFCMLKLGDCLKDMQLNVPEAVAVGDTVTLSCQYDLENEALYLMRWTLDSVEFYRYVPKEEPAARSFNDVSGVNVDMRKSNSHNVTIRQVTRNHTGLYQCEVSGDKPLFHTLTRSAQMQVAVMPEMEPTITVYGRDNKLNINYGEQLKASCFAGPSNPTVNFTWRINDVVFPATNSGFRDRNTVRGSSWESKEAWSELTVVVDTQLLTRIAPNSVYGGSTGALYNGKDNTYSLKVRCETNIFTLYRGRAESDLDILDDHWLPFSGLGGGFGAKVSPTTDLRGSSSSSSNNNNNPDNSALTGSSLVWGKNSLKHWVARMLLCLAVVGCFS